MLEEYKRKRKFWKTPEPEPDVKNSQGELRFVVQKHKARQLHYDFRLELNGVLKSWAVPKGLSLNPEEKHLAQMVEDHPFDYKDFEGVIPPGNYGAGTVMVWDKGTYYAAGAKSQQESEKMIAEGLEKGHISLVLKGNKLCGEFALVRLKRAGEASWLVIKAHDECSAERDVLKEDKSVLTDRTLDEIKAQAFEKGEYWGSNRETPMIESKIGRKAGIPKDVKPMLTTLVKEPFSDPNWTFEIKWDGDRAIAEIKKGQVNLYSRNLNSFNRKFPEIVNALQSFEKDAVFDGEIVVLDEKGRSSFELLQEYQMTGKGALVYYAFDILFFDGMDLQREPLIKRRELLRQVLPKIPKLQFSEDIPEKGKEIFEVAKKQNLEGIIGKKLDSTYQQGRRSKDWVKIKNLMEQEAVVGGFTRPRRSRKGFGALVLGVYENDELIYIGHTGGGFTEKEIDFMLNKMKPLITDESPFKVAPKSNELATWIKPELVVEVKFQEWTAEGSMRQPIFLGLRDDKVPKEVRREVPK